MYISATGRELKLSASANNFPDASDAPGQTNDVFHSGGKDTLRGLTGDDTYCLFSGAATVEEGAAGGIDRRCDGGFPSVARRNALCHSQ